MKRLQLTCACFLALMTASADLCADAAGVQSVDSMQRFAETWLGQRLQPSGDGASRIVATAGYLDPRLRLEQCTSALQGVIPAKAPTTANMTVGVRCTAPGWTVYVPVSIETELQVLVTRVAAGRDSTPADTDVELQLRRVPGLATNYLTTPAQLRDRHLKAAVGPGTALTTDVLAADILIRRGQRVTLVVSSSGFEVHAVGEAVSDATPAGRVRVMNLSSRKIVEGQVESTGRVRVSL